MAPLTIQSKEMYCESSIIVIVGIRSKVQEHPIGIGINI